MGKLLERIFRGQDTLTVLRADGKKHDDGAIMGLAGWEVNRVLAIGQPLEG